MLDVTNHKISNEDLDIFSGLKINFGMSAYRQITKFSIMETVMRNQCQR